MCLVGGNEEGAGESVSMGCDGTRRAVEGGDGGVRESERVREVVEDDGRQRESEGRVVRGIGGRCDDVRARSEVFVGAERGCEGVRHLRYFLCHVLVGECGADRKVQHMTARKYCQASGVLITHFPEYTISNRISYGADAWVAPWATPRDPGIRCANVNPETPGCCNVC